MPALPALDLKQVDLSDLRATPRRAAFYQQRLDLPRPDLRAVVDAERGALKRELARLPRALLHADDEPFAALGPLQGEHCHRARREAEEGALARLRPFVRRVDDVLGGRLRLLGQAVEFERGERP